MQKNNVLVLTNRVDHFPQCIWYSIRILFPVFYQRERSNFSFFIKYMAVLLVILSTEIWRYFKVNFRGNSFYFTRQRVRKQFTVKFKKQEHLPLSAFDRCTLVIARVLISDFIDSPRGSRIP